MKIRTGFVSNSSSSSFCIIGTSWDIKAIAEKDGVKSEDFSHGMAQGKILEYHGTSLDNEYEEAICGIEASRLLEVMAIPQAKLHLQNIIKKKFKIDIPINEISFQYGERGND